MAGFDDDDGYVDMDEALLNEAENGYEDLLDDAALADAFEEPAAPVNSSQSKVAAKPAPVAASQSSQPTSAAAVARKPASSPVVAYPTFTTTQPDASAVTHKRKRDSHIETPVITTVTTSDLPLLPVRTYTYAHIPPNTAEFTVATDHSTGKHVYMTVDNERAINDSITQHYSSQRTKFLQQLLPVNIGTLLRELQSVEIQVAKQQSLLHTTHAPAPPTVSTSLTETQLWVNKYQPRTFSELLSSEAVNRQVLQWLKGWDQYVFGKTKDTSKVKSINSLLQASNQPYQPYGQQRRPSVANGGDADNKSDTRPPQRLILLAGSPGCGKTTIAHVLSRHAGYHSMEINASDDRTEQLLMQRIHAASEMQSMIGSKKPNCIILDEIDGALGSEGGGDDRGAINALVKLAAAQIPSGKSKPAPQSRPAANDNAEADNDSDQENDSNSDNAPAARAADKSAPTQYQRRPIICICNDAYAPALRPLRRDALIIHFEKPSKQRLVDRLRAICKAEGLHADDRVLGALVEMTGADIRACLNTLQFVHTKQQQQTPRPTHTASVGNHPFENKLSLQMLSKLDIARKDMTKNLFDVWDGIFRSRGALNAQPNSNKSFLAFQSRSEQAEELQAAQNATAGKPRMSRAAANSGSTHLWNDTYNLLMDSSSESQRIADGCFHNYPTVQYIDPTGEKTSAISEWLSWSECYEHQAMREQDYSLTTYLPAAGIALHTLCSKPGKPKLEVPSIMFQNQQQQNGNLSTLHTFLSPQSTFTLNGVLYKTIVLDVLTSLLHIINPPIRGVNIALLNTQEKQALSSLVDMMLSIGLTFKVQYGGLALNDSMLMPQQQMSTLSLEPPIDTLLSFGAPKQAAQPWQKHLQHENRPQLPDRLTLPRSVRQLLAHEIELAAARREDERHAAKDEAMNGGANATVKVEVKQQPADEKSAIASGDAGADGTAAFMKSYAARTAQIAAMMAGADKLKEEKDAGKPTITAHMRGSTFISQHRSKVREKVKSDRVTYNVHFKFNDGHTNAVRRPVTVSHFLS